MMTTWVMILFFGYSVVVIPDFSDRESCKLAISMIQDDIKRDSGPGGTPQTWTSCIPREKVR